MDATLQQILLRDNSWIGSPQTLGNWLNQPLPRNLVLRSLSTTMAQRWQEPDRAHLVIGPRQAGKSTAIRAHLRDLGQPALYIDCEQGVVREWCRSAPIFLGDLERLVGPPVTLYFEEIQHLEDAGLFLKGIVDRRPGVPILVTGSSSYHLGARTRESLAGRASRARLLPFSLAEITQDVTAVSEIAKTNALQEKFERHVRYGGYPAAWLGEDPESVLMDHVESIILRDASDLFRITRPDAFRRLLRLLAAQVGSLVNLSEWSSVLGISRDTVASYLEILEASHVVVQVLPFAGGKRSELTSRTKIFLVDCGIRNQLVGDHRPLAERVDRGALIENWTLSELCKVLPSDATLHFWRSTSGSEVDFVVSWRDRLVAVEAKAGGDRRQRLPRSMRSFIEAYRPAVVLVLDRYGDRQVRIEETDVEWVTPVWFPDRVTAALRIEQGAPS